MIPKAEILIIYAYHRYPVRRATWNHLYCFRNDDRCRTYYFNLRYRSIPAYLFFMQFDLVIFDTTFAGQRWSRERFRSIMRKAQPLKKIDAPKILIPQDEFLNSDLLNDFIKLMGISHVFTCMPESVWEAVYPAIDRSKTQLTRVLTGYLDDATLSRIERLQQDNPKRPTDIGYRASGFFWFGRHGMQKIWIGRRIESAAQARDLRVDINLQQQTEKDRLHGDEWYRFLLKCNYTIGVDGGTSIHDRDGSVRACTEQFLQNYPDADFDSVEAACFPGEDGRVMCIGLSPRHLEACATRTCQILLEGKYNDVLKPGEHYIELKSDYSNLDDVLDNVKRSHNRTAIAERAYRDIVSSGKYSYRTFTSLILKRVLGGIKKRPLVGLGQRLILYYWLRLCDRLTWIIVWFIDTYFKPQN